MATLSGPHRARKHVHKTARAFLDQVINDARQIVGTIDGSTGFLRQNGAITNLGHLGGPGSFVQDINNAGQLVGSSPSQFPTARPTEAPRRDATTSPPRGP
jgi:hypothetical protein